LQKGSTKAKEKEGLACEQQRLNIGSTVSKYGIGHRTREAVQKCEEAGKQAEEPAQQAEEAE
jgi:hypothetical protein